MGNRPAQGFRKDINPQTPVQCGLSPWEIHYAGQVSQGPYTVLSSATPSFLHAYPFVLGQMINVNLLEFEVTTVGAAGSVARVGLYASGPKPSHYPTTLIADGGEYACDAVAGIKATTVNLCLSPGNYWFAYICGVAAPEIRVNPLANLSPLLGVPGSMGANCNMVLRGARTYGALPTTFPSGIIASVTTNNRILAHLKAAS